MSRDSWFRNAAWSDEIEGAFYARLQRSRTAFHKAQYLRIQAGHLTEREPKLALRLYGECLALDHGFERASALAGMGHAHERLGDLNAAAESYEDALQAEASRPAVLTNAYLDLALLVAVECMRDRYRPVLGMLESHADRPMFPVDRYRYFASRALIEEELGNRITASESARVALAAAAATYSGFQNHPKLGLVNSLDDRLGKRVQVLAPGKSDDVIGRTWTFLKSKLLH